ncbi:hypothetical protein Ddye_006345 [Dipteronia dyeriana]|uniref:Uncharacterized protein n=1 Tax=Dipteronia dyeriana TaxID=168575 RepID=A0AAD9XI68_9ROSI|nr:hypothetical protein Ddye_006345 [Dipteronia dyeriana]
MHEIRIAWSNLSREQKSHYTMHKNETVEDKFRVGDTLKENVTLPFHTRCTLTRFSQMMATFSDLQKDAVRELGFRNLLMLNCGFLRRELCSWLVDKFDTSNLSIELHGKSFKLDADIFSHVLGISNRGETISIDRPILESWRSKFSITNRGIKLVHLDNLLKSNPQTSQKKSTCND